MRASAGMTVLEAVAALALLALLLAVAVPNLLPAPELEVGVAARELAADMGLARQLAVSMGTSRDTTYVVEFRPPGGPYTSYTVRRDGEPDEPDFPKALPAGVVASGPPQIAFKRSGAVDDPGPVVEVILSSGSAAARVQVTTATGYVRVVP